MRNLPKTAILPLGRPTFDVPFAEANLDAMIAALEATGADVIGPRELLFDAKAVREAMAEIEEADVEHVLILQVTFTDAAMTCEIAERFEQDLSIWAIPEPRLGQRLRLNSFCGLNLASHALGLRARPFSALFAAADHSAIATDLAELLSGKRRVKRLHAEASAGSADRGAVHVSAIRGMKIGRIGQHPDGFDTCAYDTDKLAALAGISVQPIELTTLFRKAGEVDAADVEVTREHAAADLNGLDVVDQDQLDKSLRLKNAIDDLREANGLDAFAIRCWPETFTEYGGAVCGPVSMMGEKRVPCACEADVYGAVTQKLLQAVADQPVFLVDLVDLDEADNSGVVWHCGQAPISMRDPDIHAEATIHTNRKMPLLYEFLLKPGRVTFARISQAHGETAMVVAGGEMLKREMAFTGTSGVIRFDREASAMLDGVLASGLEHHMALAYGDHKPALRDAAAALGLRVIDLA
jgi:L-fucose isomerase-like protein